MFISNVFPFNDVQDDELITIFTLEKLSFNYYSEAKFPIYQSFDAHDTDSHPDNRFDYYTLSKLNKCPYMSSDDYCTTMYDNCDKLSFLAYNIRSVSSNLVNFNGIKHK